MQKIKKLFGGLDLGWPKLILFAVAAGAYTALMAMLPAAENTSFADITISFEVWILFGIIIIMNSKSPLDSALKCFVFFLISQPLVYLIQVPFSSLGWGLFGYYRYWFIWTILTFPMGFIGWYMKKNKWWGLLILTPVMLLLGYHLNKFTAEAGYFFPKHLLSAVFCVITLLIYPLCIFDDKKLRNAGLIINIIMIMAFSGLGLVKGNVYETDLLSNGGSAGAVFDDSCKVYLADDKYGTVEIIYHPGIEDYLVHARLVHGGHTELILEDPQGNKQVFDLDIDYNKYEIKKK